MGMYINTCVSSSVCVNRECKRKRNKRVEKYIMAGGGKKGGRDYKTETEREGQREEGRIPEGGRERD